MSRDGRFALLLILALISGLFPTLAFRGHVLFERDVHQWLYPQLETFARSLRQGGLARWDPYPGFGQPLLAVPATQAFYPWTWMSLLVEPGTCYTIYVLSHLLLGSMGVRALAMRFGASPQGALLAALTFLISGPLLSFVSLWHHLGSAAWMPWMLWAGERALNAPGIRPALLWGALAAAQLLAGSLDVCAMTAAVALALLAASLLTGAADRDRLRHARDRLFTAIGAGVFALGLGAALLLPAAELVRSSARRALGEGIRTFWSVHPLSLLQALLPVFPQELPLDPPLRALLFESREPFVASLYLGLATLPFVTASLLPRPRPRASLLVALLVVSALLALGRYGFAYPLTTAVLPALAVFRYPSKIAILAALAWALLAGLGLDAWREGVAAGRVRRGSSIPALAAIAAGAALLGVMAFAAPAVGQVALRLPPGADPRDVLAPATLKLAVAVSLGLGVVGLEAWGRQKGLPPKPLASLGTGIAVLDLFVAHHALNPTAPRALFQTPPAVVSHLPDNGLTRIFAFDYLDRPLGKPYRRKEPSIPASGAPADVSPALAAALARRDFLSPPGGAGYALFGSYARDYLQLQPPALRNLGLIFPISEETPDFLRLLRLGAVSYVVALHREGLEDLEPVAVVPSRYAGPVHLFRVPAPLPRSFVVGGVRIADGLPALRLLCDPGFDPTKEAVLPAGPAIPPPADFRGASHIESFTTDRVSLVTTSSAPGLAVLLDAYDKGWRATVDRRAVPVLRANVGFRAVPVPAGKHRVELAYEPPGMRLGAAVSVATLAAGLGLARATRRPRGPVGP